MQFNKILKQYNMSDIQYFTEEGLQKLKDELDQLKSVERPKSNPTDCRSKR